MNTPCAIGRGPLDRAFDSDLDWTSPCPRAAHMWLGGAIIEPIGFCFEHGEAIVAAYQRDAGKPANGNV